MYVVDLNVLLYAVNRESAHHTTAKNFLEKVLNSDETLALPWVVLLGFLRIATNSRIMPRPLEPEQAIAIIDDWLDLPTVVQLDPGSEHWLILKELIEEAGTAANLTTDAHLAALAIENGAKLLSFDTDFQCFQRLKIIRPS